MTPDIPPNCWPGRIDLGLGCECGRWKYVGVDFLEGRRRWWEHVMVEAIGEQ